MRSDPLDEERSGVDIGLGMKGEERLDVVSAGGDGHGADDGTFLIGVGPMRKRCVRPWGWSQARRAGGIIIDPLLPVLKMSVAIGLNRQTIGKMAVIRPVLDNVLPAVLSWKRLIRLTFKDEIHYQIITPEIAPGDDIRGGGVSSTLMLKCLAMVVCLIIRTP